MLVLLISVFCGCRKANVGSSSMAPTMKPGEKVRIDYGVYVVATPKRWDAVAFVPLQNTNQLWLMRVIGLPGERVSFTNGDIVINDKPVVTPDHLKSIHYVPTIRVEGVTSTPVAFPFRVPKDSYFLLGDNPSQANDSRFWGAIPRENMIGRVKGK